MTTAFRALFPLFAALALAAPSTAQEQQTEEGEEVIVDATVLGSHARSDPTLIPRLPEALARDNLLLYGHKDVSGSTGNLLPAAELRLNSDSFLNPGGEYLNHLDLHGLGAGRTLVMVDGRRLGEAPIPLAGWRDNAASLSDLPIAGLAGVQILPSSASSLYGSGALGGAINLVTRNPFTGFEYTQGSLEIAETDRRDNNSIALGIGGSKTNIMLITEEQNLPELRSTDRDWAQEFQRAYPDYVRSRTNSSPGSLSFAGQTLNMYRTSSCDAEANELCGDDETLFTFEVPLAGLLPAGDTALQLIDPYCEQLGGIVSGRDCLYDYGDDLMLRQGQMNTRSMMNYTQEIGVGTEMRIQFSSSRSTVPFADAPAQLTPLNTDWQEWQIPWENPSFIAFLNQTFSGDERVVDLGVPGLENAGKGVTLPDDHTYFLAALADPAAATDEQKTAAMAAFDALTEAVGAGTQATWGNLLLAGGDDASLTFSGNALGSGGTNLFGNRSYKRQRYAWHMQGQLGVSNLFYRSGAVFEEAQTRTIQRDLLPQRFDRALRGYGGSTCAYQTAIDNDRIRSGEVESDTAPAATDPGAGRGSCFYVLPLGTGLVGFVSSAAAGGVASEALTGPVFGTFLQSWLFGHHSIERQQQSLQADFILERSNPGRSLFWSVGGEYRYNALDLNPQGFANASLYSCDLVDAAAQNDEHAQVKADSCDSIPGPFARLPSVTPRDADSSVFAAFAEARGSLNKLQWQVNARLESDSNSGAQFAPGASASWQLTPKMSLLASFSNAFRFPSLAQQVDVDAEAVWVDLDSFKDYILAQSAPASSDLSAENVQNFDLGLRMGAGSFSLWLRYWQQQLGNPVMRDSPGLIAAALAADRNSPLRSRLISEPDCGSSCSVQELVSKGIQLEYRNGPDIDSAGLGVHLGYSTQTRIGLIQLGLDLSTLTEYRVGAQSIDGTVLAASFDAAGRYNADHAFGSLPKERTVLQFALTSGLHSLRLRSRSTSSYSDQRHNLDIDAWQVFDLHYSYELPSNRIKLSLDLSNLSDEPPPRALTPLGYDASQHDPYGRTLQLGVALDYP